MAEFSKDTIEEMREWIGDCEWQDITQEDIPELTDQEIINCVRKNFDGGLIGFVMGSGRPEEELALDLAVAEQIKPAQKRPRMGM